MELISNLSEFNENFWYKPEKLQLLSENNQYIVVRITSFVLENHIFLCTVDTGACYIDFKDYSIYPIKNPFDEVGKVVYAYVKEWNDTLKMWRLTRKDLLEEQIGIVKYEDTVTARVTSFYNDELAFCEFGAGLLGNISLAKYLHIKQAVYSLADLLRVDSVLKVKIDTEYKENYFSLTTYKVDDYYIPFQTGDIIEGTVLARLEDEDKHKYSYWFMVTIRIIGIIKSNFPLGYGQMVNAKVHSENENFIKFRFDSYAN